MRKISFIKILLSFVVMILVCADGVGQTKFDELQFKQFSTINGLPNNMVHRVYQDRDGMMWIATFHGLFQYDGYEVRTYKSNLYTPGLLVNNNVLSVKEDYSNRLWIGTHDGLNVLDKKTGELRSMRLEGVSRHRLRDIVVTRDNRVYFAYIRGMAYYDEQQDSLVLMTKQNCGGEVPDQANIQSVIEDVNGDLLVGTWGRGLYRYIVKENRFVHYPLHNHRYILSLFIDSKGRLWIGSSGKGLHRVTFSDDKESIDVVSYVNDADDRLSICSNYIYAIDEDYQTQTLWLGTRNGLSVMDLDDEGSFTNYRDTDARHYLATNEVNSVMRDQNGLMWIGTKGAGVFHVDTHARSFHSFTENDTKMPVTDFISSLYVGDDGAVWAGFSYGVKYYKDGKVVNAIPGVPTLRPYHISYSKSTDEVLVAAHDEGVYSLRGGEVVTRYRTSNTDFVPHNLVHMVLEDSKGNWWLGTYEGLSVRYSDGREYSFEKIDGADELLKKEITSLAEGRDGSLWLATINNGIVRVSGDMENPKSLKVKNYSLENGLLPVNTPICFLADSEGRLWAGTEGSGLCLYDAENDRFESVHQEYNLPGDMVGSMEEDEHGTLWLGTNQGLARLEMWGRENVGVRIFTVADGLPDNFFSNNASCYRNGRLYFGTSRGIVYFNSDIADYASSDIRLSITDILIDGKSLDQISTEQRRKISRFTSDFTEELVIPAAYNNFTINFASLTYNMPSQNKYAYRLKGHESDWRYVDANHRSAYYSNLKPGSYTFELRATNENGDWGDVRTMSVVVKPPFWVTWWAYLIYVALALIMIYIALKEANRRLILRNQLHLQEMETVKVQELNHVKLQFFTNITHELMTPLTIISASLDEMKEQMPTMNELYGTMENNVQRLIRLLQQILEFRKAESGNLELRVARGDIALFVRHQAESFEPLIRKQQLHFSVTSEKEIMEAYFDRDKLDKILYNLLSNAAKYNSKGGFIQLSVNYSPTKGYAVISVKDNGRGISGEQQKTLFKRFYEGDYRQSHTIGTGIGLSLTRDLVELHRGTIRVESEEGQGTQFFVEIPIDKDAYADNEIIEIIEEKVQKAAIADRDEYEEGAETEKAHDEETPTLLLAEDNEELLAVMVRLLQRDYKILQATNGRDALDIIKNSDVDLVVSDVVMPEMDGMELTREIKADLEICHIPVILLTAKSTEEDRGEGYTAGADAYLTKPFNLSALHARIKSLLKVKQRAADDFKRQLAFEIQDLNYTDMDEKFLQDAIDCVNRNLSNSEFDVSQFVEEMGTSRTTLHKKLKSLTGLNTTGFVRNVRLKAACRIMDENKTIRISELAYSVGFNDPKYFSICFKKEFGMQPTEYIEKYTEGEV